MFDVALAALRSTLTDTDCGTGAGIRSHQPTSVPCRRCQRFLARWREISRFIVDDGFHQSQRNKVAALGLEGPRFHPIVYTPTPGVPLTGSRTSWL